MRDRCEHPHHPSYKNYGGRGIKVCERWLQFTNFNDDMGERPPGMTLERRNYNGNYEPSNCVWASRTVQNLSRRFPKNNKSKFRGVQKSGNRWFARIGFEYETFRIGSFETPEEAAWMFDQWALVIHGDVAQTNFSYIEVGRGGES
jgi:hypothetical protein